MTANSITVMIPQSQAYHKNVSHLLTKLPVQPHNIPPLGAVSAQGVVLGAVGLGCCGVLGSFFTVAVTGSVGGILCSWTGSLVSK